jgi:hypothetical protein
MTRPISLRIRKVDARCATLLLEARRLRSERDLQVERVENLRELLGFYNGVRGDAVAHEKVAIIHRIRAAEAKIKAIGLLLELATRDVQRINSHRRALSTIAWVDGRNWRKR